MSAWALILLPWVAVLVLIIWDASDKRLTTDPIVLLTGVLVLCTAASCVLAFLQWRVLEQTDNTFWAGQRPWVGIKNAKLENIHFDNDDEELTANVRVTFSNYGNLPATNTGVKTLLLTYLTTSSFDDEIAKREALSRRLRLIQDFECSPTRMLHAGDLAESSEILTSSNGASIFPKESSEITLRASVAGPSSTFQHIANFYLPGCFLYAFGENSARIGSTFFVLEISPDEPARVFDVAKSGEISPSHADLMGDQIRAD